MIGPDERLDQSALDVELTGEWREGRPKASRSAPEYLQYSRRRISWSTEPQHRYRSVVDKLPCGDLSSGRGKRWRR